MAKKQTVASGETFYQMIERWTQKSRSPAMQEPNKLGFRELRDLLQLLDQELYQEYEPLPTKAPFLERLAVWLHNVATDKERQILLELVTWLLFVGPREMKSMYCAAFNGPVTRWIIDKAGLDISDPALADNVRREIRRTFFGSMAGMDMGSFFHSNNITGQSLRPPFRELSSLGNFGKLQKHLDTKGFVRIVAVEDMVGTGTQMQEAAPILASLKKKQVLFCPIIVAPEGVKRFQSIKKPHFEFRPLFVIPENATLPAIPVRSDSVEVRRMRHLVKKTWDKVQGTNPSTQLFGPFGYGDFGSLVLSYSNCPDNVPPLVHYDSEQWTSLFPRNPRED